LANDDETFETADQEPTDAVINKVVSAAEFKELLSAEGAQVIDVRTPGEVAQGAIEGATNFDFYEQEEFKDKLADLDKEKPVLVYCKSGGRSGKTASMLKEMGFKEVYDLEGGYSNWSK
jgi:rhodanese-related sulfurtransferase